MLTCNDCGKDADDCDRNGCKPGESPMFSKEQTYSVSCHCGNCGWSGQKAFPRGQRAPAFMTCPRCDTNEVRRS